LAAAKEMGAGTKEWNDKVRRELQRHQVEWIHPAPYSSSKMGAVESLIGVVRRAWFHVARDQTTTEEGLATVAAEVEAIVNNRPLTLTSDDPKDPEPLTPSHILLLRGGRHTAPGVFDEKDLFRRRWRQAQFIADQFWRRFRHEYVSSLHQRTKWLRPKRNLKVGDLVMVVDSSEPRGSWLTGIILEALVGPDGNVRTCRVRLARGTEVLRSIGKLVLLEAAE